MLFLLTGDVQIGKTRWLERLASELYAEGCEVAGVVAPACGARRGRAGSRSSASTTCCCRTASASRSRGGATSRAPRGLLDPESQSEAAQLAWHISDDALARVNAHFGLIAEGMCGGAEEGEARPRLLVVDELGRLELERGCASSRRRSCSPAARRRVSPPTRSPSCATGCFRAPSSVSARRGEVRGRSLPTTARAASCAPRATSRPEGPSGPSQSRSFSIPAPCFCLLVSRLRQSSRTGAKGVGIGRASFAVEVLSASPPSAVALRDPLGGVAPRLGTSALAVPPSPCFASPPLFFCAAILARRIPRRSLPARALVLPRHRGSRALLWRTGTPRLRLPRFRSHPLVCLSPLYVEPGLTRACVRPMSS